MIYLMKSGPIQRDKFKEGAFKEFIPGVYIINSYLGILSVKNLLS